jgi:large subunit ribosomal protein L15
LIRLDTLSPAPGSRKDKKRVGRGDGSRKGSFSGRGCKGQKGRAGFRMKPGFEGGQLPIIKRLPSQRGFNNIFKTEYDVVNVAQLNIFEPGTEVDIVTLMTAGLVKTGQKLVKILGDGEIDRPLTVKADKFTAVAKAKIEAVGGKAEEVVDEAPAD